MKFEFGLVAMAAVAASATAIDKPWKRAVCSSYTLLSTRGTYEPQGDSLGFKIMNKIILNQNPGGKVYNTVYPAAANQNSSAGEADIINHIHTTLTKNPYECFILQGYSQGAAATVNALPNITGASFAAVKGVFLLGNPEHKPNLACNVDNFGGKSTANVTGLETNKPGIPERWVAKTLDVCIFGDGVCDTTHGKGINKEHLEYINDPNTQSLGTAYAITRLRPQAVFWPQDGKGGGWGREHGGKVGPW